LEIFSAYDFVSPDICRSFHYSCQSPIGGFSKVPGVHPDVLHTYFSLCALRMLGDETLLPLNYALGLTQRAFETKSVFDTQ
jgi:geranylgeranyl transferase type-1 subunit beta